MVKTITNRRLISIWRIQRCVRRWDHWKKSHLFQAARKPTQSRQHSVMKSKVPQPRYPTRLSLVSTTGILQSHFLSSQKLVTYLILTREIRICNGKRLKTSWTRCWILKEHLKTPSFSMELSSQPWPSTAQTRNLRISHQSRRCLQSMAAGGTLTCPRQACTNCWEARRKSHTSSKWIKTQYASTIGAKRGQSGGQWRPVFNWA